MALGKNMKIDRIIPLSEENNSEVEGVTIDLSDINEEVVVTEEASSVDDLTLDNEIEKEKVEEIKVEEIKVESISLTESEPQPQSDSQPASQPQIVYENVDEEAIKITFIPSRRKTQKRILINIEGALTINNVDILYSKVNIVFDNYDFVEVTMTNITDIDLTVIQLFHAIRVAYWPQNKFISINAEFSRDDRKLLNTCGFTEFQTQKTDA